MSEKRRKVDPEVARVRLNADRINRSIAIKLIEIERECEEADHTPKFELTREEKEHKKELLRQEKKRRREEEQLRNTPTPTFDSPVTPPAKKKYGLSKEMQELAELFGIEEKRPPKQKKV